MLQDSDLKSFSVRFAAARTSPLCGPRAPNQALPKSDTGLYSSEVLSLSRSLQIASVLGDATREEAVAADLIGRAMGEGRRASLDDASVWEEAISWALTQPALASPLPESHVWYTRQQQVGLACSWLRGAGYEVTIGAHGPALTERSILEISRKIENLIRLVGGMEVVQQVCRILKETQRYYDGMWLFGDRVPGINQTASPAVPFGWLFSLGLKHAAVAATARKPAVAWRILVLLATNFTAALDCQRYGQFEEMNIAPTLIYRVLRDSLVWRELFSLPQVPPMVLPRLATVLRDLVTPDDQKKLGLRVADLFREIDTAIAASSDERPTQHIPAQVENASPILWRLARARRGEVNPRYLQPIGPDSETRNQGDFIFFEISKDHVITLPRSMIAAAACEVIFKLLWSNLDRERAKDLVGRIMETAIERACQGKTPILLARKRYKAKKCGFDLDVAAREGDRITLFETKAKSLTANARSGDIFAFFSDYADSYLGMLKQLMRHEVHLREGITPLTTTEEKIDDFWPLKVAVSPLSYGPVSDKLLSRSLLLSLLQTRFTPVNQDEKSKKATDKLNDVVADVTPLLCSLAPQNNGFPDLAAYLINVFWVDLGQLLYVLDRSLKVCDALIPLKHITFSTRDFWTEMAIADQMGVAKGKWKPLAS